MPLSHHPKNHSVSFDWMAIPLELQVRILSSLRAHDLSSVHRTNRYFWKNTALQHAIVVYCAEQVYPKNLTQGYETQPITCGLSSLTVYQDEALTSPKGKTKNNFSNKNNHTGKNRSGSLGCREDSASETNIHKSRSISMGSLDDLNEHESTKMSSSQDVGTISTEVLYTFEHLRNMELLVVARVLNSPEPATGFVVSKSWCKAALQWLESKQDRCRQQQQSEDGSKKKKKTKKERLKERKQHQVCSSNTYMSTTAIPPPPANVNSDITCEHDQLQHYTSSRSARARRRLLDKQAWKILKALYPESTPLPTATGECLLCRAEACQIQKAIQNEQEAAKQQRKLPLKNESMRRFYTRTRGVPEHCLRRRRLSGSSLHLDNFCEGQNDDYDVHDEDTKMPAHTLDSEGPDNSICPLVDGTYYVLPRSWCHGWRRFIKTGEGGMSSTKYAAPDATCLLCDGHRMALLPPHLAAFLCGESSQLLEAMGGTAALLPFHRISDTTTSHSYVGLPIGQAPAEASIRNMRSLGLSDTEISLQLNAMRTIEAQQQRLRQLSNTSNRSNIVDGNDIEAGESRNERLDRENHTVVEILTEEEFRALEACWPGLSVFALRLSVQQSGKLPSHDDEDVMDSFIHCGVNFCTPICQTCDATGRQCSISVKNRARKIGLKKNTDKSRVSSSATLEY